MLGSILIERDAIIAVAHWMPSGYFYLEKHSWIYEAMLACYNHRPSIPPDISTVADELRRREQLDAVGGIAYLGELSAEVPIAVHVEYYARIVERAGIRRNLIQAGGQITVLGYNERDELDETLAQAEETLRNVTQRHEQDGYKDTDTAMQECLTFIRQTQEGVGGLSSGIADYDRQQGGLFRGDLVVLAARPGVGKTMLALHIAEQIAQAGGKVGFVSLEMSTVQLGLRLIAMLSGVSVQKMRTGQIAEDDEDRIIAAMADASERQIFFDDKGSQTLSDISRRARHLNYQANGLDLLVVDYIGMIRSASEKSNRVQELEKIANGLKAMAKELECPVLVLSQLSRAVESRANHVPQLSDLRDSGGIEQAADVVAFLYREEMYDKETSKKGVVEMHIAKSRQGQLGTVLLYFDAERSRFHNVTTREPEGY
jgi:replicative DNA helicase